MLRERGGGGVTDHENISQNWLADHCTGLLLGRQGGVDHFFKKAKVLR